MPLNFFCRFVARGLGDMQVDLAAKIHFHVGSGGVTTLSATLVMQREWIAIVPLCHALFRAACNPPLKWVPTLAN